MNITSDRSERHPTPVSASADGVADQTYYGDGPRSRSEPALRTGAILLALLPVVSFLAQYAFSVRSGTTDIMLRHLTVMVVDWIFVPINFLVVRVIDWTRGGRLYAIVCLSVILNVLAHAQWQYNGVDFGHMITKAGIVLPAGWVHLAFSCLEMALLAAFVFCRRASAPGLTLTTAFATLYFVALGICGYLMHRGFIASDVVACSSGLFFVLLYPALRRRILGNEAGV